ncbi:type II toxin-antitoxin system VapC family toxin [Lacticaseibacillus paracasei subsp. tolerans]|uniref:type II toxin-antitoxin system VapC family toxin n=1 Tax=Lacticaseibacillus paracasei TaxID=1597 RepID=UPI0018AD3725|nr:type II toxin-antitoxin system VapC family toxin [Lacticaseibacillus paracasei]QPI89298.1 type II toxin-antitoxin system VapC family toxin [Lacticaseibacillus paracasei subsp. tolerans]
MGQKYDASSFPFSKNTKVLIDTNIWVYIEDSKAADQVSGVAYTDLLYRTILPSCAQLYTTPLIIEEYINQRIRLSYSIYLKKIDESRDAFGFKHDYCPTQDFAQNYDLILSEVQDEILQMVSLIDSSANYLTRALDSRISKDFNDEMIIQCALMNKFYILTNDRDFIENSPSEVGIITL